MMYLVRFVLPLAAVVATCGLLLAADPAANSVDGKVTGLITRRGKPLTGKVTFHLGDQFVGAKIKEDGNYTINRVPAGEYIVTLEGSGVPAQYTVEDKTPLRVEVRPGNNTFNFELP